MDESRSINKEEKILRFGEGIWIDEPDNLIFEYKNYKCEIFRNSFGALCGYVFLNKKHPWYKKDYTEINADVHGGLTFSEKIDNHWVIGFDCAHFYDYVPYNKIFYERFTEKCPNLFCKISYKDINFVRNEIYGLVDQAKKAEKGDN